MKKLTAVLVTIVALCTWVQAQDDANINPLNVARALSLKTPAYFEWRLSGNMLISNSFQRINMQFTMRKSDFGITNLVVNNEQIELPEPIYGIPLGDGGLMTGVYCNVVAKTAEDVYAGSGYLDRQSVSEGEQLVVKIRPADIRQDIPIDVSQYGNDISLKIEGLDSYGWSTSNGKFYIYLPPIGGKYHYTLRRQSDNTFIGEGWVEPFKDVIASDDAYLGVRYIGNVIGADFPNNDNAEDWIGVPHVEFNCTVPTTDGSNILGKVVFIDAKAGGLEVIASGSYWIYVQQATDNGDMPFLELKELTDTSGNQYVETRVRTIRMKAGKVVVTIIPKPDNLVQNPWVNFHRYYELPNIPSGGGSGSSGSGGGMG